MTRIAFYRTRHSLANPFADYGPYTASSDLRKGSPFAKLRGLELCSFAHDSSPRRASFRAICAQCAFFGQRVLGIPRRGPAIPRLDKKNVIRIIKAPLADDGVANCARYSANSFRRVAAGGVSRRVGSLSTLMRAGGWNSGGYRAYRDIHREEELGTRAIFIRDRYRRPPPRRPRCPIRKLPTRPANFDYPDSDPMRRVVDVPISRVYCGLSRLYFFIDYGVVGIRFIVILSGS